MHEARVVLQAGPDAEAVLAALGPEAGPDGAELSMSVEGDAFVLTVRSDALGNVRAALAGVVRLADAALRVAKGDD